MPRIYRARIAVLSTANSLRCFVIISFKSTAHRIVAAPIVQPRPSLAPSSHPTPRASCSRQHFITPRRRGRGTMGLKGRHDAHLRRYAHHRLQYDYLQQYENACYLEAPPPSQNFDSTHTPSDAKRNNIRSIIQHQKIKSITEPQTCGNRWSSSTAPPTSQERTAPQAYQRHVLNSYQKS